jgi:hypothetical protein
MAGAKANPTRIDDAASKASSNWLSIVEDVFARWRDRLGSSKDAGQKLVNLLCDPETRSKIYRVDASGEEDPATVCFPDTEFWPGRLVLDPDADGGDDHLVVNYGDTNSDFYDPDGHWKFDVRRLDVERWERLFPELAPPSSPTTAGAEARAIAHLKPLLELRRDAMLRDEAWEECKQFNISRVGFEDRVWPTARLQAGLQSKAPAGRKRRKPVDIEAEVEQVIGPAPDKNLRNQSPKKSRS